MYCPSCDKSYGAVHSRCPECHSWLKVSAPASSRTKSVGAASAASLSTSNVSTLDKEPGIAPSWPEPPTAGVSDWAQAAPDSWADVIPAPPTPGKLSLSDPAPLADGAWGGAPAWGGLSDPEPGGGAWGGSDPAPAKTLPPTPAPVAAPPASGSAWLDSSDDGWSGLATGAPGASAAPPSLGLSGAGSSPILGGGAGAGWAAGADKASSLISSTPSLGTLGTVGHSSVPATDDDGWGGGVAAAPSSFISNGVSKPVAPASQGWLAGAAENSHLGAGAAEVEETSSGWLGDSRTTKVGSPTPPRDGDGWLGGDETAKAPSMTEMVDRAIGVEEADDFVDDSWVDEEVSDGEFDDLEVPDYRPPTPELGNAFLKMLLVAVLVLLVGGGVMFMGQEKKTEAQIKAEAVAKELTFARSTVETGKTHLKEGNPLLAVGPLEAAMGSFKSAGASQKEILDTKVLLARALMKAQEYQKAYGHWTALSKAPPEYRKEAKAQMLEASKLLRAQAGTELAEAAGYIKNGEASSVVELGKSALKIYEAHKGTASQKGKAYGVIGRGYLNGKEYGKAKQNLHKARALNPGGGYESDLSRLANAVAPVNYYNGGGGYSGGGDYSEPVRQVRVVEVNPRIDAGDSGYVRSQGGAVYHQPRSAPSGGGDSSGGEVAPAAPARMKEVPAYNSGGGNRGSKPRLGSQGVVNGY